MSTPFIGQLLLAAFNFAPRGFAMCNGQLMAINQNMALFSLLGTVYGGDGVRTFGIPNLQGRTPIGIGTNHGIEIVQGEQAGEETHTLIASEAPVHTHQLNAAAEANLTKVSGLALLAGGGAAVFSSASNLQAMNAATLAHIGGSQPHENRQPFLVMNWCIALTGIFPSRS